MRHKVKGRKLSRTASHRKATMQALSMALVKQHRIVTTTAKAKELRGFIEPLITRAKVDNHHNRKIVFSSLQHKDTVTALFSEIGPKCKDRPGGYTRIIKAGFRKGDGTELAIIELVDYNDIQPEGTASTKKKRTRRSGKSNNPTPASKPVVDKSATAETAHTDTMDDVVEVEDKEKGKADSEEPDKENDASAEEKEENN